MGHKFNINDIHKLDNEARRKNLPPKELLIRLGIKNGDTVADIGCGIGYFSFPAAELVGKQGYVYAVDIVPELLAEIQKKIASETIGNMQVILSDENNFKLESEKIDFLFTCNVLHETENISSFLQEAKQVLKRHGRLAIIDWRKIKSNDGPPIEHRLDEHEVERSLTAAGFKNITAHEINENYFAFVCDKN